MNKNTKLALFRTQTSANAADNPKHGNNYYAPHRAEALSDDACLTSV